MVGSGVPFSRSRVARVSKRMETLLLRAPKGDPRQLAPILDNVMEIIVVPESIERRVQFEEHAVRCLLEATRLHGVNQGLPDLAGSRLRKRVAGIGLHAF